MTRDIKYSSMRFWLNEELIHYLLVDPVSIPKSLINWTYDGTRRECSCQDDNKQKKNNHLYIRSARIHGTLICHIPTYDNNAHSQRFGWGIHPTSCRNFNPQQGVKSQSVKTNHAFICLQTGIWKFQCYPWYILYQHE